MPDNCSNHPRQVGVAGIDNMKILAEMIGDLHYETLAELLDKLTDKIFLDAAKDRAAGRLNLAKSLENCAGDLGCAQIWMESAWQISKPFMTNKTD
jgi:hypothetical protein